MSINYAGSVHPITTASGWKTNFFNTSKTFYSANSWTLKSDPLQYDGSYEQYENDEKLFEKYDESYGKYENYTEVFENNRSIVSTSETGTFTEEPMTTSSYKEIHKQKDYMKTSKTIIIS